MEDKDIVRLEVVKADIDEADRLLKAGGGYHHRHCPIAMALRRKFSGSNPYVTQDLTMVTLGDGTTMTFQLDMAAEVFMSRYDCDMPVEPAEFNLRRT